MAARIKLTTRRALGRYDRPDDLVVPALRRNGGVVALAAVNGPGAFEARFGDPMAKKKKQHGAAVRATLVRGRGGAAKLVFAPRSLRSNPEAGGDLSPEEKKLLAAQKRAIAREASYKARAAKTPQYRKVKKVAKRRERVAFGAFKRYRSPTMGLTYGYLTSKGKVKKIPTWAVAGAPSASAFESGQKWAPAKERIAKKRAETSKRVALRFKRQLDQQERAIKRLAAKQERELKKIQEGKSIMAPNRRRKKHTGRAKTYAKRLRTKSGRFRANARKSRRRSRKIVRGTINVHLRRHSGKRVLTRSYAIPFRGRKGKKGKLRLVGSGIVSRRKRAYTLTANHKRRRVHRRAAFRRNGTFTPFLSALKSGAPVLGGLAGHRLLTGLIASAVAPSLPMDEAYKVPLIGVVVAGGLAIAAKAALPGETGVLVGIGAAVSSLHQLVLAALRAAGQNEAATYLAGIPTQRTTAYGAYELIDSGGVSGFGTLPYAQAAAGYGTLPYAQAAAGYGSTPYAARGNYLDVPSLGAAYPEQAAAGYGNAYPEQAAAGYGSYELTQEGITLNGIGTTNREIERELDIADRQGSVGLSGFGADSIGRENITIPDGAVSPVMPGTGLPLTDGNWAHNVFGVSYG